jgi:hypothetical protein
MRFNLAGRLILLPVFVIATEVNLHLHRKHGSSSAGPPPPSLFLAEPLRAVNLASCTLPSWSVESAIILLCLTQPDRDQPSEGSWKPRIVIRGPLRAFSSWKTSGLSSIHLLDAREKPRFESHRRSVRWTRSGTQSGRAKTRFDLAGTSGSPP